LITMVDMPDGRRIAVEEWGSPTGDPIFLLHGTPGSRLGPIPRPLVLYQLGIRLITFDRPGYGCSDRMVGRMVADIATDVRQIADFLRLQRFAVLGRSGGGPHALACAALLPDRTTRAAVLVGLAPSEADGLDWFADMTESNVEAYLAARNDGVGVMARLRPMADRMRRDPAQLVTSLYEELTQSDRRIVADVGIKRQLTENYAEAVRHSADGWVDDLLAFAAPWGFECESIKSPIMLWHGADDTFSPVGHSRWLGAHIRSSVVIVEPGSAHFGALNVVPHALRWLAAN
jgi:pimeloyl-ACP methyl ester carboxylesterase